MREYRQVFEYELDYALILSIPLDTIVEDQVASPGKRGRWLMQDVRPAPLAGAGVPGQEMGGAVASQGGLAWHSPGSWTSRRCRRPWIPPHPGSPRTLEPPRFRRFRAFRGFGHGDPPQSADVAISSAGRPITRRMRPLGGLISGDPNPQAHLAQRGQRWPDIG